VRSIASLAKAGVAYQYALVDMVTVRLRNGRRCDRIQFNCLIFTEGRGVPMCTVWWLCNVMIVVVVNNCFLPLQFRNLAFVL
jgi:hypothetical protein